ncbi:hypothetical protein IYW40_02435 [Methylocystis sp. H4A]|uniref:hypothetical protein n=1 Tax=Methylocystis sp. H4A TaxID=2785788 RepID=UPI0018C2A8D4|nr:hypothetical protein [Methylocystis sp. H4A]MBG0800360.1 hypothetical protein [Methylocystis sp. H4A]
MSAPFGKWLIVATIAAILAIPAFFFVARATTAWRQGYDWAEMDWDDKGHTSIADFLRAADVGKRPVDVNGQSCVEYFIYRDGITVKIVCPQRRS